MKQSTGKAGFLVWTALAIPVVWLAVIAAQCCGGGVGLMNWLGAMNAAVQTPLSLRITPYTFKAVAVALATYGFAVAWYYAERGNRRPGEEHGSAKWGNAKAVDKKYRQNPPSENKLMTQAVRIGLNGKKHRRNLNTLVCGGSGAGKTRFYCKPNLMQANTSFVILDPNGKEVLGYILQALH